MAVRIDVDYTALDRAKAGWHLQADTLDGTSLRLAKVTGAGLTPPVKAEVERFVHCWHREVHDLASTAQDNHDAFVYARGTYEISDLTQAERIRSLLPWAERHDPIRQA